MPKKLLEQIPDEKRTRILNVAAAEFASRGYAGANINDIATRAGIGKGSIYLYFHSKQDLYFATCYEGVKRAEEMFAPLIAQSEQLDFFDLVAMGVERMLDFTRHHRDYYLMYLHATHGGQAEFHDELVGLFHAFVERHIRPLVRRAQERGALRAEMDTNLLTFFYATSTMAFQDAMAQPALFPGIAPSPDKPESRRARIELFVDLLRRGMAR